MRLLCLFLFLLIWCFHRLSPRSKKAAPPLKVEREGFTSIHDTSSLSNRTGDDDSSLSHPKGPLLRKKGKKKYENTFTHLYKTLKYPNYTVSHSGCHKRKRTHKRRSLCGILTRGYESSLPASTNLKFWSQ